MARTSNVFARVDPILKENAEQVLAQLGIPMSGAVSMFLHQIVLQQGIPFEMKLPKSAPLSYESLSREEFNNALQESLDSISEGKGISAASVAAEMKRDFGI